jgi:hypothetical protein
MRPTGFYWVQQLGASEPEVARWEHECWWVTGEKRQLLNEDVRVLSARIVEATTVKEIDWKKRAKRAEALLERYTREYQPGFGTRNKFYDDVRALLIDADQEDARVS